MGTMSIWHWLIVLLIVVLMFGRGKISEIMGDVAKGIKSFKKGMAEDEAAAKPAPDQKVADQKVLEPAVLKPTDRTGANADAKAAESKPR
ncbi:MAG: twin-arginine translocase TatA/TatE family subunit [Hyphomicrobiaceae bacterium]